VIRVSITFPHIHWGWRAKFVIFTIIEPLNCFKHFLEFYSHFLGIVLVKNESIFLPQNPKIPKTQFNSKNIDIMFHGNRLTPVIYKYKCTRKFLKYQSLKMSTTSASSFFVNPLLYTSVLIRSSYQPVWQQNVFHKNHSVIIIFFWNSSWQIKEKVVSFYSLDWHIKVKKEVYLVRTIRL
jgi:hypothetical protein